MHKEITIYDIAKKLGISATTVSRGLNDNPLINKKTREKIHQTAKELGYRHNTIASNLRKRHSKTIGILLHEVNSYFVTAVLAGIEKVATAEQYDLLITHAGEDSIREIANTKNLLNKRVDGVIVSLTLSTRDIAHFNPFFERNIPVVFFDRVPGDANCSKVVIDNFKCGELATKHLIEQGCKKIAHITADLTRNVYNDRFEGYKKALEEHHIKFNKKLLQICNVSNKEETIAAVDKLLGQKPDAFFITNDFAAAVCIDVLHKKGLRVPEDIAVFGFNNDLIGDLITPRLSTIDYPGKQMGEVAAHELIKQLKSVDRHKKTSFKSIVIPSKMIIRESSLKKEKNKNPLE
ncbi:LacI family transcriptional regulator [Arachidicoccus ginsenosidimutans]|uniref:LacI family DNA-binding transcriptional regulator n=1 Tax=Arachidicoccus sp. BS20 TaxID=1850526 RepID=UPI0007F0E4B9|nr:LacI family DNA-binding transcriptional regulator [Arachidicoccus sp. BS20]ANI88791.1 LacI family transcriptional regulator [Arachidicoccus sp. BS20]